MKKFTDFKFHILEASGHLTEGKMNDLSVSIGDHIDKHIDNYKKHGGAEDLMVKAGHVAKKIAKQHKIKIQHAHNFVRDYMEKRLSEAVVVAEGFLGDIADKIKSTFTPVKEEVELTEGRPSQRHPLEGHEYHRKTDAELEYIGKDAHKAAEAMKGHNEKAENKYRDQANDAATVRYFRKKSGTPDWYKKKYGLVKEKTELPNEENLDEMTIAGLRTSRDLTKHLKKNGWTLGRTTGGHDVYVHATNKNNIAVPRHKGDIPPGTVRNIIKTAGLHNEGFSINESRKSDIIKKAWKSGKEKMLKNVDDQTNVESISDAKKDSFQKDPEMSGEIVKQ